MASQNKKIKKLTEENRKFNESNGEAVINLCRRYEEQIFELETRIFELERMMTNLEIEKKKA